jgi:hypothetical protein
VVSGGSVALGGGVAVDNSQVTIHDNLIQGNTVANPFGLGGGMALFNSQAFLRNNRLLNNSAGGYGGGLYIFDGFTFLTNTVFVANQAITGGAGLMVEGGSSVHLRHTTFNDNGLDGSDFYIGGDSSHSGSGPFNTVWLTNTILANYSTGISVTEGNNLTLNSILWYQTPITISAGITATVSITHEFNGDPAFTADGYHLTAASAALGRGIPAGVPTDIDGDLRPPLPDLGADEYGAPPVQFYLPLIVKDHQNQF